MVEVVSLAAAVIGIGIGVAFGWLIASQKMKESVIRAEARIEARAEALAQEKELFLAQTKLMASDTAKELNEQLIKPFEKRMEDMARMHTELEKSREGAYQGVVRHLKLLEEQTQNLGTRATALTSALTSSSQVRGNWGEVTLRNLFEKTGMMEHVDFTEQEQVEGGGIPDFIVRLPGQGVLPIDSKATAKHFLEAAELDAGSEQDRLLSEHAKALKGQIKDLSSKAYQDKIEGDFDHVVLFIPSEALASAAFSVDPDLMEYALSKRVLLANPVTMFGLLRTIALYWQQHSLAEGALEIYEVTREMYKRTVTLMSHTQKVGAHLDKAGKAYNEAMRSYESRILPHGRKLEELKVSETLQSRLPEPDEVKNLPDDWKVIE
jgi:DNA recombination protein RmuC